MNQDTKIIKDAERMTALLEELGENAGGMAKKLGIHPTNIYHVISSRNKISDKLAAIIASKWGNVNPLWLTKGSGEMFLNNKVNNNKSITFVEQDYENGYIATNEEGGDSFTVPGVSEGNLMRVRDDAMAPIYNPGDVIAYRKVTHEGIIWGKNYIVTTGSVGMIRTIEPSTKDDSVKLVAQNEKYKPIEIRKDKIKDLAKISTTIKYE